MSSEKATALVLRTVDFSESSCVVTLLTREFGKVRAMAKGARRLKGPFDSALDLLAVCRIVFRPKSSDVLDLLTEAKLLRRFRPPNRDLGSLYAGYYIAELLNELTDEHDPHPKLFDESDATLIALSQGCDTMRHIVRLELYALHVLGHLPQLWRCVECGGVVPPGRRVAFGPIEGGLLCAVCRRGKKHVISVTSEVIQALRQFADVGSQQWRKLDLDKARPGELRAVLNQYLSHLAGRPFRMHRYLFPGQGSPPCASNDTVEQS